MVRAGCYPRAGRSDDSRGIAGRVEHLFDAVRNPKTGKPYTNAEVARMTLGDLSEQDIEGIRDGALGDPSVGQIRALACVFGVEPSYLLDRGEPVFDGELVKALRDGTLREAALEISRLSERDRQLVLGIVRQFGMPGDAIDRRESEGVTRQDLETDEDKRNDAWHLNMQRRHLNELQKRAAIAAKLRESPSWADNRIAQLLGVDGKTVRSERTSLEIRKEIPKVEMLEGKDGKYYPRSRTGDLEAELAVAKTDAVRQDIMNVGNSWYFKHASEEERHERAQQIAIKWGVSTEHVEDQLKRILEQGPRLKDLGEEKSQEVLAEAFTAVFGTGRQIKARHVRDKMRDLADLVTGHEGKKSEADPEAVAEAVVGYYVWVNSPFGVRRFDKDARSQVRTDVRRYKVLSEWIERLVPLLEEKLEKRLAVEREVSELRHELQEDEGINPPPL